MRTGTPVMVVAAASDAAARRLVERWPEDGARLLTPLHLTTGRWTWRMAGASSISHQAVLDGVDAGRPEGVVSLLDAVRASDVPHVRAEDRGYVAAEATAFLQAWQHSAVCPKLNAPSLSSLCGELHPLVWRAHAIRCGMSAPAYSTTEAAGDAPVDDASAEQVTLIGNQVIGTAKPAAIAAARALGRAARVRMLQMTVSVSDEVMFYGACVRPDLDDDAVAEAITRYFKRRLA